MLALLYGSGLRIAEALALRPRDLDLDKGIVRVTRGKGGKTRTAGIEDGMAAIVREWMDYRAKVLELNGSKPLFCQITKGRVGRGLSQAAVRSMLKRRTARAGLDRRIHCHAFRHSHAANLSASGAALNVIQRQLGHANISTTSRYLDHVAPEDVLIAVRSMGS